MDDYLSVGEPMVQWLAARGEWNKIAVRITAIECVAVFKHAKASRKMYVVIRGKGGEQSNFTEALGELLLFSDAVGPKDVLALAFPADAKPLVVTQMKGMPNNWKRLNKLFNCAYVFFVSDGGQVEAFDWPKVMGIKI